MRSILSRERTAAKVFSFRRHRPLLGVAFIAILGVACSAGGTAVVSKPSASDSFDETRPPHVAQELNPNGAKTVDLQQLRQLLPKDAIRPIYEPKIGAGSQSTLPSGELVIGVNIGDDSRAYPIKTLRFREMVNDRLGGIPILVTW